MTTINKQELIDYYTNLLIIQYNDKPKARATIALWTQQIANIVSVINDINQAFNIETAVGGQLDILGKYIGLDRFVWRFVSIPDSSYFSFITYDTTNPTASGGGFVEYGTTIPIAEQPQFLSYADDNVRFLSDVEYRFLLKLKISQNNSDHTRISIDETMWQFFGNTIIPATTNRKSMSYIIKTNPTAILQIAATKNLLPRPLGVRLKHFLKIKKKIFAFKTRFSTIISPLVRGCSDRFTYSTPAGDGEMLTRYKIFNI